VASTPSAIGIRTLEQLRADLPFTKDVGYFQTGTYGPTTNSVIQVVADAMRFEAAHGSATSTSRDAMRTAEEAARGALAKLLNVKLQELAITTNTSRAMQLAIRSINWTAGDELIVSSAEHVSTTGLCWELERRRGVKVSIVTVDGGNAAFLEGLKSAISPRTRMVCVSEIASHDGRRLPIAATCEISHERGVPVMVDGAQAVGQFPVDVRAQGCDFYVGSGHKWLLGPMGTGFIFVASDHLEDFRPDYIPDRHPWAIPGSPAPEPTARARSEIGTYNHALVIGLGAAIDIALAIGLQTIENHSLRLSYRLRQALLQLPEIRILTPLEPGRSAGITSFMIRGYTRADLERLTEKLWKQERIVVKAQWLTAPPRTELVAARVSVAGFNTEDEIDRLVAGLGKHMRSRA